MKAGPCCYANTESRDAPVSPCTPDKSLERCSPEICGYSGLPLPLGTEPRKPFILPSSTAAFIGSVMGRH